MDLFCEKYKEKMESEGAACNHPGEYCKFRTSCMIHFLTRETVRNSEEKGADEQGRPQSDEK